MVDVASHLRESGFNDEEIGAWAKTTRENLTAAGFKDEEVDDYLGLPKTPKNIPAALVERMMTGAKFVQHITSVIPKAYSEAYSYGQSIGHEAGEETINAVKGVRDQMLPKEFGGQREGSDTEGVVGSQLKTGGALLSIMSLPFAPLTGALHAIAGQPIVTAEHTLREGAVWLHGDEKVRQAETEAGLTPGGMTKEDANKIIDTAIMGLGSKPVSRIAMGPGGVPEVQTIGGLPKGEDFSNAGTTIGHGDTTPAMEGKLQDLYEQKGIHPIEVAHDAQTDVTITQSMLSTDKADMPAVYAYHGSPHSFESFDMSKIGTGEGAQSYGHGLYFAENPAVAGSYQRIADATVNGRPFDINNPLHKAADLVDELGSREAAITEAKGRAARDPGDFYGDVLRHLEKDKPLPTIDTKGALYKVRINADRESFLDWDQPVPMDSPARQAALDALKPPGAFTLEPERTLRGARIDRLNDPNSTGSDIYQALSRGLAKGKGFEDEAASKILKDAGVPGIKYLDQGSRDKGGGTSNLVVFDDKLVDITHKNGEPVTGPERAQAMDILNERQPSSAGASAVAPPAYSDAQSQVLSKISIDEKAPTAKLTWDKLYTNTMDKLFPIAKAVKRAGEELPAEENPYQLARLMAGSAGKADHFLNNGTFDFAHLREQRLIAQADPRAGEGRSERLPRLYRLRARARTRGARHQERVRRGRGPVGAAADLGRARRGAHRGDRGAREVRQAVPRIGRLSEPRRRLRARCRRGLAGRLQAPWCRPTSFTCRSRASWASTRARSSAADRRCRPVTRSRRSRARRATSSIRSKASSATRIT
jgi:hypothetical protein